jgi:hypothetical protein
MIFLFHNFFRVLHVLIFLWVGWYPPLQGIFIAANCLGFAALMPHALWPKRRINEVVYMTIGQIL